MNIRLYYICVRAQTMDTLITTYGLHFPDFQQKAIDADLYMAGSSALALFLKQHGVDSEYTPNDIDLYFRGENKTRIFREYLLQNGYSDSQKIQSTYLRYSSEYDDDCIRTVESYTNKNKHEIQLITLEESHNIIEYIVTQFDLSICATWWIPAENEFKTFDEKNTLLKNMYFMHHSHHYAFKHQTLPAKLLTRLTKYDKRGFAIRDTNTHANNYHPDLSCCSDTSLADTTAFDMWQYEDINTTLFLKQSEKHIILKIKNVLYAFDRHNLYDYMKTRRCFIERGVYVYVTPMNQCIPEGALKFFTYPELTIFELIDEQLVTDSQSLSQSIFTFNAFTSHNWVCEHDKPNVNCVYSRGHSEIRGDVLFLCGQDLPVEQLDYAYDDDAYEGMPALEVDAPYAYDPSAFQLSYNQPNGDVVYLTHEERINLEHRLRDEERADYLEEQEQENGWRRD